MGASLKRAFVNNEELGTTLTEDDFTVSFKSNDEKAKSFASCTDINTAGMVRVSFGIYSTEAEVDEFLNLMPQVMKEAKVLQESNTLVVPEY